MTVKEVMTELETMGSEQTKKTHMKHGAKEPVFGVKVGDMKKIVKKVKKDYELSKELYATGNSDAMYLAGLIADEKKMTKADLERWKDGAYWSFLSEYTVPWVASESEHGMELGLKWIDGKDERTCSAGWATLSNAVSIKDDEELDLPKISELLERAAREVHQAENRVRYTMNGFIICVGCYVTSLSENASALAAEVGKVSVDMGGTACKVPLAKDYIKKVVDKGRLGKKRKMARC